MSCFMQNLRATLIPAITVPVVLLGTLACAVFGYSINTLTMFGTVLAIGLLVNDAIVVVESVERLMSERGLDAREKRRVSRCAVAGALIGSALVLSAVFIPMAFLSVSDGRHLPPVLDHHVSSMLLSVFVAMTLTPALSASLPCRHDHHADAHRRPPAALLRRLQPRLHARQRTLSERCCAYPWARQAYSGDLRAACSASCRVAFVRLPTSFLPTRTRAS